MARIAKFQVGTTVDCTITEFTGHAHTLQATQYSVMAVIVAVEVRPAGVWYTVDDGFNIYTISEGDIN